MIIAQTVECFVFRICPLHLGSQFFFFFQIWKKDDGVGIGPRLPSLIHCLNYHFNQTVSIQ